ncbi:peptidoglycan DD-metalloendopeptidase family protein [Legionella dresdenensis]|uniref:Peptidoglycan DD-metalloendopeptidase family protein n=1 Tax=Legionella dresdenensis TaxID=450200 RepID=A0ABV8CD96_9GAMM
MDQRLDVSINNPGKPSRLLALIALIVAFALPFILVKSFPQEHRATKARHPVSLSIIEEQGSHIATDVLTETTKNQKAAAAVKIAAKPAIIATTPKKEAVPAAAPKPAQPAKQTPETARENEWKIVKTRSGDTLANIFNRAGISQQTLNAVLKDNPKVDALTRIKPDQEFQFQVKQQTLQKMIVPFTTTQYMVVYREGSHYKRKINSRKMNSHNHFLTAKVNGSLYTTAKRNNIPYKLIQQMSEIFTWDIDFAKDVRAGDQFTIIYKAFYIEDKLVGTGDIIAVSYRNHGKMYQAVRYTDRRGRSEYYTPQGTSLKKAFTRYPLHFSHISSTFSLGRYHPILHYTRAHKGIDLAARIGTPIQATGDGYIEIIGRQNGYGNMIKIKHSKTYSSIYGHMLKFQKGLSKGSFVRKGQIIGYVGQTGLASGPHCHYEFHINNQPRNPATIDLPRGEPLSGRDMASFKANSNTLLAQLKLYEDAHLASAQNNRRHG